MIVEREWSNAEREAALIPDLAILKRPAIVEAETIPVIEDLLMKATAA